MFYINLKKTLQTRTIYSFNFIVCSACLMCVCENNKICRFLYIYIYIHISYTVYKKQRNYFVCVCVCVIVLLRNYTTYNYVNRLKKSTKISTSIVSHKKFKIL